MNYGIAKWYAYNEGLVNIVTEGRGESPIIASGCGHFMQRDDPAFVGELVWKMFENIACWGSVVNR